MTSKKDLDLIAEQLEVLEILKGVLKGVKCLDKNGIKWKDIIVAINKSNEEKIKHWLESVNN